MAVLAIETSSAHGSVAVMSGVGLLFSKQFLADRKHGASLFTVLAEARTVAPSCERIAIGLGPGSYAGVRIAISAGIGLDLAYATIQPRAATSALVGIPSVAGWNTGCPEFIAVGDARRETFYWTHVCDGMCIEGPMLLESREVFERVAASRLRVFGCEALPAFPSAEIALPSAEILARLALANRGIIATSALDPIYLREPHITQPRHVV